MCLLLFVLYFTFTAGNFCDYCYTQFVDAGGCVLLREALKLEFQTENRACYDEAISWCWQNTCVGDCIAEYESCDSCKTAFQIHGGCSTIRGTEDLSTILLSGCEHCPFVLRKQNCVREGFPEFSPIIPGGMDPPTDGPPTDVVHEYKFMPICASKAPSASPVTMAGLNESVQSENDGIAKWVIVLISMIAATVLTGLCCVFGIFIYRKYRTEAQFEIYAQEATFFEDDSEADPISPLTPRLLYVRKSISKNESDYTRKRGFSKTMAKAARRRSQTSNLELQSVITVDERNLDSAWEKLGRTSPRGMSPRKRSLSPRHRRQNSDIRDDRTFSFQKFPTQESFE